jgi:hypothetical protein
MAPRPARWILSVAVTIAALLSLARASAVPLSPTNAARARLRLSWSARPERIEVCRALSREELERREEHMRQSVECDGRFATYALRVDADEHTLHESVVRGAGLRHDRPIYLLRDIDVDPGVRRIRVSLVRREKTDNDAAAFVRVASPGADTGLFAGRAQREAVERERRARAAIPPALVLDTTLAFAPGRVVIVTLDAERGALRLLGATTPK